MMTNLELYKRNPSAIQRAIFSVLDEVTDGTIDIVDPTNPFVFLMESSAVNTALAINENYINTRRQYPSLAQTTEELYLHMSDRDYLNRFSVPSETIFTVMIDYDDLIAKMEYDALNECRKCTFARETEFFINDLTFTLQYPIDIKYYNNNSLVITYDADIVSPIETLHTNIIDYIENKDFTGKHIILFNVPVKQMKINSTMYPIQQSVRFYKEIPFTDEYYYVRVFYKGTSSFNLWKEIKHTHTEQVFDPYVPTAVIRVLDNYISVSLPLVYVQSGLMSGQLRVDIYTTKGNLYMNLNNYKAEEFSTRLTAIDEVRDLSVYVNALSTVSYIAYSDKIINGGKSHIDFTKLRERIIFNSLGEQQTPITNVNIETKLDNAGFEIISNLDVVTNRAFLALKKLPL
jgi:hypothetical protein